MKKEVKNVKKDNPLVSIVIPVYNGENYVNEAIDSAINQTYKNIEIIVVDDGSKDKTEEICKSYGDKIRYFKKENGGVASALNFGIKKMKGEYFSWLSHDDLYDKNKIKYEINELKKINNKKSIITCNYDFVDTKGNFLYSNEIDEELLKENNALKHLFNYTINGCSLLINKVHFDKVGFFNEQLLTTQDFDMWFRIFRNENIVYLNKILVHSRVHDKQDSKRLLEFHIKECDDLWINFIESLTVEEKEKLYGTSYDFYNELQKILKKFVNYPNVFEYLELEKIKIIKKDKILIENYLKEKYDFLKIINEYNPIKNKSRILFANYGAWDDRGGLNRAVANIANNLTKKFDIFIFTSGDISKGYNLNKDINIICFNSFDSANVNNKEKILCLLKLFDIDVYINPYNCIKELIELCNYVGEKGKIKTIAWNHEYYFLPYYNKEFNYIIPTRNDLLKKHDLVFWLTSASQVIYNQFANNAIVMNNALTLNNNLTSSNFSNKSIISIGRFDDVRKCAETLIILAKKLKDKNINIKIELYGNYNLDLIGNITHKPLKDLLKEYNLSNKNIEFMGFTNNIQEILKHAKIHIIPSYHEGFGLTIIEAASYGIPTIGFNDTGFEDIIVDGYNGYLIERNDFDKLAKVIKELSENENLFQKISSNCKTYIHKFSINNIINRWEIVLDALINNKYDTLEKLSIIDENIDKNHILINGIKEYETSFKNILNENIFDNNCINCTNEDTSYSVEKTYVSKKRNVFRKCYRKLPFKLRRRIKKFIQYENNFFSNFLKKYILFDE